MITFASRFSLVKAHGWRTFSKCGARCCYHLVLPAPYFENILTLGLYPTHKGSCSSHALKVISILTSSKASRWEQYRNQALLSPLASPCYLGSAFILEISSWEKLVFVLALLSTNHFLKSIPNYDPTTLLITCNVQIEILWKFFF